MAMSHQLWMSGRPHGPHRWENQGPGQSGPGHLSSLPRGRWVWWGYCPGCSPSSLSALIRQIDSDVVWSLRARLADELAKDQLPSLLLAFLSPCCKLAVKCMCVRATVVWLAVCCCWYDTTNTGKTVFLSLLPSVPFALEEKNHLSLKTWSFLFYWRSNLYLFLKSINILPEISSHGPKHTHSHRSLSLIDDPVPEYWSLSTNEIVHRQRFQSIRER